MCKRGARVGLRRHTFSDVRTCATGTCSRGGGGLVGRHRERARAPRPALPRRPPTRIGARSRPARRPVVAAVTRRRAHTHPARSSVRARARTATTRSGSVCTRAVLCARQLCACVCARVLCASATVLAGCCRSAARSPLPLAI